MSARVKAGAFGRGLWAYPGSGTADGGRGDHMLLAPPYIVSDGEIEVIVASGRGLRSTRLLLARAGSPAWAVETPGTAGLARAAGLARV